MVRSAAPASATAPAGVVILLDDSRGVVPIDVAGQPGAAWTARKTMDFDSVVLSPGGRGCGRPTRGGCHLDRPMQPIPGVSSADDGPR